MKLYVQRPDQFFYYNVKMTASICGSQLETVMVDDEMAQTKDLKVKKAHGAYPFLEFEDGTILRESTAISAFLARSAAHPTYLGESEFDKAQVSALVDYNTALTATYMKIAMHSFGYAPDKEGYTKAVADLKQACKLLNDKLKGKEWFVGNQITLADVSIFNAMIIPFSLVLDPGFRKAMPEITRWFDKMSKLPEVIAAAGSVMMMSSPAQGGKGGAGGKGGKKGGAKQEKKEEAPKAAAAAAADDEVDFDPFAEGGEDDEATAAQMKAKAALIAKKAAKKPPIAKSLVLWDVKGWDDETDLNALGQKILAEVNMDGLVWKTEYKLEPVAFGVKKLVIGAVIEDEKVSADGISEAIEAFEDYVQSVDIAVFNKL